METLPWLITALGSLLVGIATGLVCRRWYGRTIAELNHRLEKSDKARQFSSLQTTRARKQIETLQKELAAQRDAMARAEVAHERSRRLEEVLKAAEPVSGPLSSRPVNGFADTQPMAF